MQVPLITPLSVPNRVQQFPMRFRGDDTPSGDQVTLSTPAATPPEPPATEKPLSWLTRRWFNWKIKSLELNTPKLRNEYFVRVLPEQYQRKGRIDKALATIESFFTFEPPSAESYRYLSGLYQEWGKQGVRHNKMHFPQLALETAQKAVQMDPAEYWGYRQLADLHTQQGQPLKALEVLEEALPHVTKDQQPQLLQELGKRYLETGQVPTALKTFDTLRSLQHDDPHALTELSGRLMEWAPEQKPVQDFALHLQEQAKILAPDEADIRGDLGKQYVRRGMVNEAMLEFHAAYQLLERKGRLPYGQEDMAFLEAIAQGYLKGNRPEKAAQVLEDWALFARRDPKPHLLLGGVYSDLDATVNTPAEPKSYGPLLRKNPNFFISSAISHYKKASELDKQDPQPHRHLANIYKRLENMGGQRPFPEGLQYYTDKFGAKAYLHLQLQALQEATHVFETMDTPSEAEQTRDCQTRCAVSTAYEQLGNIQQSLLNYAKVVKRYPKQQPPVEGLGRLYQLMRQPLNALKTYQEGTERNPDAPWSWLLLGDYCATLNRTEESRKAFEKATTLLEKQLPKAPNDPTLYIQLDGLYQKLNQPVKAKANLKMMADRLPEAHAQYCQSRPN